jgi:DNA polymerase III subunit epsilon
MNTAEILNLDRPLCFFDIESTGVEPQHDRIITLSILKVTPEDFFRPGSEEWLHERFNPVVMIPAQSTAIHGITDAAVADKPKFSDRASAILEFMNGCDLAGFNLTNFDVPILWEECHRAGVNWDLNGVRVIDVSNIFRKKEERTLAAAVRFYCGREITNAHDAEADVVATRDVLLGQLARYTDLQSMGVQGLSEFSKQEERVDLAGAIILDKDGDYAYTHRRVRGVKVADDPGYAYWMLKSDFSANTKMHLKRILGELFPNE